VKTIVTAVAPRVFVSSVVEGFEDFRQAAREGIHSAGGVAVLVNEDFPAQAESSRNVCLDAVSSCDHLVCIIGPRGGWTAPSGKLVVEEEIEEAKRRKIPLHLYVQEVARDADADRIVRQLSDYVGGTFRRTFSTPQGLKETIQRDLHQVLAVTRLTTREANSLQDSFRKPYKIDSEAMLRFVLTPEREDELIDPTRLRSEEFRTLIYGIGVARDVGLLGYEHRKEGTIVDGSLVILQDGTSAQNRQGPHVRLQVLETGELTVDANVTGRMRRGTDHSFFESGVIDLNEVGLVLRQCFAFANALYADLDPFRKYSRFLYNVGLSGLGYRNLERNPVPRSSFTMNMRGSDTPVVAHKAVRTLSRDDLSAPGAEIERTLLRLEEGTKA